ncbi:hypothetical protein B0H13DRAFT_1929102 [Mycena leptocephala]|nr:hypothetical protein B0H13DRAFT_1929102 [Mycena leptocephala]
MDLDLEPLLPLELEREIFETTARMYPGEIPTLLRVARRFLVWIEPLLYTVIILSDHDRTMVRAVLKAVETKPPEFFHAVRHLVLIHAPDYSVDDGQQLLRLCSGVINFGSTIQYTNPTLLGILAEMRVRRLSLTLKCLFAGSIDLTHRSFGSITHLDIFDEDIITITLICAQIPTLPALTHLSLDRETPRDIILTVLAKCPRLELLLVLWQFSNPYKLARFPFVYDVRFVIGQYNDYWDDWKDDVKGLRRLWSRGDDFVARKRRGEVEGSVFNHLNCILESLTHRS